MPIEHIVDQNRDMLRVRRWGSVSTHDEDRACVARARDPLVHPGIPVLVDCREVEPPDAVETVRYLADCVAHIAHELQCGPVAILVNSDVAYGMARMYMALTELTHPDTEVFRDLQGAESWLASTRGA